MTSEHGVRELGSPGALSRLEEGSLAALSDLSLSVSVRIGTISLTVAELLELSKDAVITLDQRVDEPVQVVVGERVVALGELVSVGDEMGVRITEIAAGAGRE